MSSDDAGACAEVRTWRGEHGVSISLTVAQIAACSHSGPCDDDVARVCAELGFGGIGASRTPDLIRRELNDYGAWDDSELLDDAANLRRIVWIAACDLSDTAARVSNLGSKQKWVLPNTPAE